MNADLPDAGLPEDGVIDNLCFVLDISNDLVVAVGVGIPSC